MDAVSRERRRGIRGRLRRVSKPASPSERTVLRAFRWLTAAAIFFMLLVWVIPSGTDESSATLNLILAS